MSRHAYRADVPLPRAEGFNRIRTKSVPLTKPNGSRGTEPPKIYMWVGSGSLFVSADLRDIGLEALRIRAQGMSLIFDGTLRPELPTAEGGTHQAKKAPAAFSHVLELPYAVNGDDIDVQNENGLVSIVLKRKDSGRQNDRAAQSSLTASMERFFGGDGDPSRGAMKDEIAMLETFERYLAFQSVKGLAR